MLIAMLFLYHYKKQLESDDCCVEPFANCKISADKRLLTATS